MFQKHPIPISISILVLLASSYDLVSGVNPGTIPGTNLVSTPILNTNEKPDSNKNRNSVSSSPLGEKIRDVEAIDPGLLQPAGHLNGSRDATNTHGKQFSNPIPNGNSFSGSDGGFHNNFGPSGTSPSSFNSFPNGQTNGAFPSGGGRFPIGQPSVIGGNAFPAQGGALPGGTLPPGSVGPDTVAFSAARASDFTRVGITQVRFDYTLTDVGYGWYPDRSEFVCYYPGLYFFTFSGLSPQTRQFKLSLVRNNQEVVSAWGDSNGYQMGTNSAILILNQGDRVYIILQEGNLHETNNVGHGYTTFSGFKIR